MRTRLQRSEQGSALVIVLIFMSVFGIIVAALLTESDASFGFTNAVSSQEKNVYAADAGVSFGIQQLHLHNELCPAAGVSGPPIPNLTVNGRSVSVTCDDTTGGTLGADGYAIITTSTGDDSLDLQGASGQVKKVGGPVYVSGKVDWGAPLQLTGGNFYHRKSGAACPGGTPSIGSNSDPTTTADLRLDTPPYGYYCTTMARPDPAHSPPVRPTAVQNPLGIATIGNCRIFTPGLYTAPPVLLQDSGSTDGNNYFVSGVYYFTFNMPFDVTKTTVYGGQPNSETRRFPEAPKVLPSCAQSDPPGTTGTGVEWIFGGGSSLTLGVQGKVELFRRTGETTGTNSLSLVGVPNETAWTGPGPTGGWAPNTLPSSPIIRVFDITDGNTADAAIHGLVYAPNQSVGLTATNSVLAQTLGGIVAYTVALQSSASASGFAVSVEPGAPGDRHVMITACSPAAAAPVAGTCVLVPGTERPVMSTAIVAVANDVAKTTTVESWRTRGPSD